MKFETFLKKKWGREGEFKDPDLETAEFDVWLVQLDAQEWLNYAEAWGEELSNEVREAHKNVGN